VKIFFLEIGHIGYQKIENFMLISKMQKYLSGKMTPKKVKIKKRQKMGLSKFRKQLLNFNFFGGHFVTKTSFFFKSVKNSGFFDTLYNLFQEKKFSPLRRADFKIYQHKNRKKMKHHKIKKNAFSKIVLDIFYRSKST
jgi:hypothetical protein